MDFTPINMRVKTRPILHVNKATYGCGCGEGDDNKSLGINKRELFTDTILTKVQCHFRYFQCIIHQYKSFRYEPDLCLHVTTLCTFSFLRLKLTKVYQLSKSVSIITFM